MNIDDMSPDAIADYAAARRLSSEASTIATKLRMREEKEPGTIAQIAALGCAQSAYLWNEVHGGVTSRIIEEDGEYVVAVDPDYPTGSVTYAQTHVPVVAPAKPTEITPADVRQLWDYLNELHNEDGGSSNDFVQAVDDWFTNHGYPTIIYAAEGQRRAS